MGFVTAIYFVLVLLLIHNKRKSDYLYNWCWWYSEVYGWLTGIRYQITGREYFDKSKAYVIATNHNAVADMFIMVNAMKGIRYRPLSKVELKSVPLFGFLFKHTLVFVDRKSPESRKHSVEMLEELINCENISVMIFPEGTRNRTLNPLKEFYDGAFRIAIECKVPIIPMVMLNTKRMTPQNTWTLRPGLLICHFLPPISTEGLTDKDIPALKDKVYHIMEKVVLEHWKEHGADYNPL